MDVRGLAGRSADGESSEITGRALVPARLQTWIYWALRSVHLVAAFVLLTWAGALHGSNAPLVAVNPKSDPDPATGLLDVVMPWGAGWTEVLLVGSAAIMFSLWPTQSADFRGVGQMGAGLYLAAVTSFFAVYHARLYVTVGDSHLPTPCTYENCWPMMPQEWLRSIPTLVSAFALILSGTLLRKLHWAWRVLIPLAVFFAATAILACLWEPMIIPWLAEPRAR